MSLSAGALVGQQTDTVVGSGTRDGILTSEERFGRSVAKVPGGPS
jgi:hypothetical protein